MSSKQQDTNTADTIQKSGANTVVYGRDELLHLKHHDAIKRCVRKELSKHNIWNPHNCDISCGSDIENTSDHKQPSKSSDLKLCLLNPCSACNKALVIRDFIIENNLDVLALTEVWGLSDSVIADLLPVGFDEKTAVVVVVLRLSPRKTLR